jgi:TonB family protein
MPCPRAPRLPRVAPLAGLLLAAAPGVARAQIVMGVVIDSTSRRPLPSVAVHLVGLPASDGPAANAPPGGARDSVVARGLTAGDGVFTLSAPAPGRYRVRIGAWLVGPPLALASADTVDQHLYPVVRRDLGALLADEVEKPATVIRGSLRLHYPETLQAQNIEGGVTAQFVIDTAGLAEMGTWTLLESSHEAFAWAAYDAVRGARFRPAEISGRKVRQLVEMPLTFTLRRGSPWLDYLPEPVRPATRWP